MMGENWNDAGSGFHPVSAPDYLPAPQLRELQLRRLKAVVERAYANVPPFRERMAERGLTPASIETLVDLYTEEYHHLAKVAKDTAAGAVMVAAIMSVCVGLIIFLPKFINWFF